MTELLKEWTPAALAGAIAVLLNQWSNWRKERRIDEDRKEKRDLTTEEQDADRYRKQVDGMIQALERRVTMAEEAEAEALRRVDELETQIAKIRAEALAETQRLSGECEQRTKILEEIVDRISRKLALLQNGR